MRRRPLLNPIPQLPAWPPLPSINLLLPTVRPPLIPDAAYFVAMMRDCELLLPTETAR